MINSEGCAILIKQFSAFTIQVFLFWCVLGETAQVSKVYKGLRAQTRPDEASIIYTQRGAFQQGEVSHLQKVH